MLWRTTADRIKARRRKDDEEAEDTEEEEADEVAEGETKRWLKLFVVDTSSGTARKHWRLITT